VRVWTEDERDEVMKHYGTESLKLNGELPFAVVTFANEEECVKVTKKLEKDGGWDVMILDDAFYHLKGGIGRTSGGQVGAL